MLKYSDIIVQPMRNHRYKVMREILYHGVLIPKGYRTNGGNVPRILWAILPPNESEMLPLYIIHDYLCDQEKYRKADDFLLMAGKDLKVTKWKLKAVYYAVRLYHKIRYNS